MTRTIILLAALAAAVGCSAAARPGDGVEPALTLAAGEPPEPSYQPYVTCDVLATPTRHGVRIEALAHAGEGVSDTIHYDLTVTKDSAGGSSDIVQNGEADLVGGETITLGEAEFSIDRRGRYRAQLVLTDADDGIICSAEARS